MLAELDDSNVVSRYKNEDAAEVIRMLLGEIEFQRGVNRRAERQTRDYETRIEKTVEYLSQRSQSNGVLPRALAMLRGEVPDLAARGLGKGRAAKEAAVRTISPDQQVRYYAQFHRDPVTGEVTVSSIAPEKPTDAD